LVREDIGSREKDFAHKPGNLPEYVLPEKYVSGTLRGKGFEDTVFRIIDPQLFFTKRVGDFLFMRNVRIQPNTSNNKVSFVISSFCAFAVMLLLISISLAAQQFTDELNRQVTLNQFPPQRLISVAPNITEILFALGLENQIVGVTDFCDYPVAAKKKPKIGGFSNPNLEQIIALKPDLVVITADSNQDAMTKQLWRLNIPVYIINPQTIFGILTTIHNIGQITGTLAAADKLNLQLQQRIEQVEKKTLGLKKPKVLFLWSEKPLITAGLGTFTDSLIELADGINIAHASKIKYPKYSMEEIIRQQPEVIIVANMQNQIDTTVYSRWQKWIQIPAVRNHQVYSINSDIMARPAPRIIDGLEELEKLIHK
jgi:iron complex transport system substrate-binding protein